MSSIDKPAHAIEIFLQPGEVYFGERNTRIRTLLGSCVAITMWHPNLLVGGMCHYMLPKRNGKKQGKLMEQQAIRQGEQATPAKSLVMDGRYADEAMELMLRDIMQAGTLPREYQVKLFGGGHMFSGHQAVSEDHVGAKNVEMARVLMKRHGFSSCAEHLGGVGHRNIIFDIWSGDVWVRHQPPVTPEHSGIGKNAHAITGAPKHIPEAMAKLAFNQFGWCKKLLNA